MNVSARNQDSKGTGATAAARVSPVQSRAAASTATASAASGNNKRKDAPAPPAPPGPNGDPAGAAKKTKAVTEGGGDAIKKEIRELLEKKLMGAAADDGAKLEALRKLNEYWDYDPNTSNTKYQGHRRATIESAGCHLVLIVLRQELGKGEGANRRVVQESINFLLRWNCFGVDLGETMLRFDGVSSVARAMKAFPQDQYIQYVAVLCFNNFSNKGGAARVHGLLERGCLPLIIQALPTIAMYENGPKCAVLTLGRMCEVAGHGHFQDLVDAAVMEALVDVFRAHNEDSDERVRSACRAVMNKLLE